MEDSNDHKSLLDAMKQNADLIRENNILLKKIHKQNTVGFWIKILWYAILIGIPFAVYFYVLEPYFEAFGANYDVFKQGMAEIPGLKGLEKILP